MFSERTRSNQRGVPKIKKIVFFISIVFSVNSLADTVVSCIDGDTCRVKRGEKIVKVRLSGIDAPETGQPGNEEAKKLLEAMIKGKNVTLNCRGTSYGRENCSVFESGTDIQKEMVRSGWALDYPQYSKGKYKVDQELARISRKGVWSFRDFVSPYCYKYLGAPECEKNSRFQP